METTTHISWAADGVAMVQSSLRDQGQEPKESCEEADVKEFSNQQWLKPSVAKVDVGCQRLEEFQFVHEAETGAVCK